MFFKISSFHAYTHQDKAVDDIENCAICDLAVKNQQTEFTAATSQSNILLFLSVESKEPTKLYSPVLISSYLPDCFFGRPPPSLA